MTMRKMCDAGVRFTETIMKVNNPRAEALIKELLPELAKECVTAIASDPNTIVETGDFGFSQTRTAGFGSAKDGYEICVRVQVMAKIIRTDAGTGNGVLCNEWRAATNED
jgi:hypothetical protein